MKKYLLIYRATPGSSSMPEEENREWSAWFARLKEEGSLVDIGVPVQAEGKVVLSATEVADKPLQSAAGELVIAYSIIQADSLDQAAKIVQDGPAVKYGCTVELREVIPM